MTNPPVSNLKHLASALNLTADLLDVLGEDTFRARAYRSAARSLEREERSLSELKALQFAGVKGVGKGIAAELMQMLATGQFAPLEEVAAGVPLGVQALLNVRGLGPKKVQALWAAGIDSLESLLAAAQSGQLEQLRGFGAKGAAKLAEAAAFALAAQGRFSMRQGRAAAEAVLQVLQAAGQNPVLLGDVARQRETVSSVKVGVADPSAAAEALAGGQALGAGVWEAGGKGGEYAGEYAGRLSGVPVQLVPTPAHLPTFFPYDEPEHAAYLEGGGTLPDKSELITLADIRGMLHTHTLWSDGTATARDMLEEARRLGCSYYGTADHSQAAAYAGGLSPQRLREAIADIRGLQAEGLPILVGAEVDILRDGSLDYDDELLAQLDYVVASVHSAFDLSQAEQTSRIVQAASHPLVSILGHPTGRLLLRREGYALDMDAVLEACAAHNTAAEINANPWRLDTDWRQALRWRGRVKFSVNTDAHSLAGLGDLRYGVLVAQKAGLTAADVVNCLELEAFKTWARGG